MKIRFLVGVSRPFLNKIYSKKVLQHTIPKKDIYTFLPLGKLPLSVRST